jgi:hypothetical protein
MGFEVVDADGNRLPGDWPQSEDRAQTVMRAYADIGAHVVRLSDEGDAE